VFESVRADTSPRGTSLFPLLMTAQEGHDVPPIN
jgi:hypothetical protein